MASLVNYTKRLKKNQYQLFTNSSNKLKKRKTLSNSLYEARITLIPKLYKGTTRKETTDENLYEYRCKHPTEY